MPNKIEKAVEELANQIDTLTESELINSPVDTHLIAEAFRVVAQRWESDE